MKSDNTIRTEIELDTGRVIKSNVPYTTVRKLARGFAESNKLIEGNVDEKTKPCFMEVFYFDEKAKNFNKRVVLNTNNVVSITELEEVVGKSYVVAKKQKAKKVVEDQNEGQMQIEVPALEDNKLTKGGVVKGATPTVIDKSDDLERFNI